MTAKTSADSNYILIVSRDGDVTERYSAVLQKNHAVQLSNTLPAMHACIAGSKPVLIFVDPLVCRQNTTPELTGLLKKLAGNHVVVIENATNRMVDQRSLFKAGARGFCRDDITPALLVRAVAQLLDGEYWIPRKLISRMISELANEGSMTAADNTANNTLISSLTPRELQVARMVHLGGNNKMIARELDISERTVKAHLSAIFRKLDIENRLNLALFFNEIS